MAPFIHSAEGQVVRPPSGARRPFFPKLAVETADLGVEVELLDDVAGVGPLCPQGSRAIISFTNAVPAGTFCPSLTSGH